MTPPIAPVAVGSLRSAQALAFEDARAIALQWKDRLREKVFLEKTSDETPGVAESYAWIRFEINFDRRTEVSAARAAAVAWFALSCCPGYGGKENPVFWKGVFNDLVFVRMGQRIRADQTITDAFGFFDRDSIGFPRFKLQVDANESSARLFCGVPGEELEADDKAKLSQIMESLAPWVRQDRTARRPEVSLEALASALPMTTSIRSVRIDNIDESYKRFERKSIVWIAYALFHPDTPSSPWKSLILRNAVLDERSVLVLQAVARGNNLMAMLHDTEPISDGYYRARLAAGGIVYDQPSRWSFKRSKKTAIITSDGDLEVDVCDVASEDPKRWRRWVAVIVPSYGLGWVRSAVVASVVKRAAATASLTQLTVSASYFNVHREVSHLGGVLSLIGRRLVHLDIRWYVDFASSADLLHALSCCPLLESLRVQYQVATWDSDAVASVLPRWRELDLRVIGSGGKDTHLAAFNVPPSLHLLRIHAVAFDSVTVYRKSADAIRHILLQPNSPLRVFHWRDGYEGLCTPMSYWRTRVETKRRLRALNIPLQCVECVDTRLPAECAAAFWSVISQPVQHRHPSAVTRLDKWMAMSIVAFAGSKVTKSIVIEPTTHEMVHVPAFALGWPCHLFTGQH